MSRTRVSQVLAGILFVVLVGGAFTYIHGWHRSGPAGGTQTAAPMLAAGQTATPAGYQSPPAPDAPASGASPATLPGGPADEPADAPTANASNLMAQGRASINGDDLLTGRALLNEALSSGQLSDADAAAAKKLIAQANQTIIFSPKRFADDPFGGVMTVPPGGVLARIARTHDTTPELLAHVNDISDPRKLRAGATLKIIDGPFHAVVTKSKFTMDLYLGAPGGRGSLYVTTFPVGLGKDDSTPTGTWIVEPGKKLKNPVYYSPRGAGVIAAADPKNPLGKLWIGLTGTEGHAVGQLSYGIHGTIDPSSIGKQSSMGCIRMNNDDVALVFEMLVEGKSIVIVRD